MWGRRRREGVVIHRRYSKGPLSGSRHDLVAGHGVKIRWSSTFQTPSNVGGRGEGSNEGVGMSG